MLAKFLKDGDRITPNFVRSIDIIDSSRVRFRFQIRGSVLKLWQLESKMEAQILHFLTM